MTSCSNVNVLHLQATIATITKCQQEAGVTEVSLLNFVVSDGINMIATRYVSHDSESPASLYYAEGSAFQREQETGPRPESATPGAASNAASARNTAVTGELCIHSLLPPSYCHLSSACLICHCIPHNQSVGASGAAHS